MNELPFTGERVVADACARTSLYLEHVSRYRQATRLAPGRRVLDAATGAGYGAELLAAAGATEVVALDLEPQAIEYAVKRYGGSEIQFRVDDVLLLNTVRDASIDLYVCLETIEHVEDGAAVVRQAARVLAPDGIFFCSTPNWEVSRCQNPFHRREYRPGEFVTLLQAEFPHVALLTQRTLFANRIGPATPGAPRQVRFEQDVALDDLATAPYLIAVASRTALPPVAEMLALGACADTEHLSRYVQMLEGGVAERDRKIARLTAGARVREERERALQERQERAQAAGEHVAETAAEVEARNRHIQNLEGGVAERDARIRDLEIALNRRETVLALSIVRALARVNRLLGRFPARTLGRIRHAFREGRRRAPALLPSGGAPLFSLVVPVHNNHDFLDRAIESALGQTCSDAEIILYDDASSDPRVGPLLERYRDRPGVRVIRGERNLGISGATNRGIAEATGLYVAFLDCDDELEPSALERVAEHIARHPEADFVYTNRADIDEAGRVVERWDFTNRSLGRPDRELLLGMFASHLKVIRREAFHRVGLFRREFDSVQDYDLALRLSEVGRFAFLRETLYRHRIHPRQTTQQALEQQDSLAGRAKDRALLRRRIASGGHRGLVSIVVLSLNRPEDTEVCLDAIARHTPFEHEVILIDNGSSPEALARLRRMVAYRSTVTLRELPENLGCGGGRNLGVQLARGDYLVFLDNDVEVDADWLAHLLTEMEWDANLAACCCRVSFPDGTLQFNGGRATFGELRASFDLLDTGRRKEDLRTLQEHACDWVPGGATIFRKAALVANPYDLAISGAYEDNDWSIMVRRAGWRLANCPLATATHHHMNFSARAQRDGLYRSERYSKTRLEGALRRFHEKHGFFIDEEDVYRYLGYQGSEAFIESTLAAGRSGS